MTQVHMTSRHLLVAVFFFFLPARSLFATCGTERWPVKTGTDNDAGSVDLSSATPTTIANLTSLAKPSTLPQSRRIPPAELTQWTIDATLVEFALEGDQDYHLVISDNAGHTMIVEIPDPNCVGTGSPFASGIANARSEFDSQFTVSTSFQPAGIPVRVKGVAMFDIKHPGHLHGVAPNQIELHPVLDIVFNPAVNGDFALTASPSSITVQQGGTSSTTLATTTSDGFNSSIALAVSNPAPGLSVSLNSITINNPSTDSSTLTVKADANARPDNYGITISGKGGGQRHTMNVVVTVTAMTVVPGTSITGPTGGSTINGTVNVTAASVNGTPIIKMEIYIDGAIQAWAVNSASLSFACDTTKLQNGSHTIGAKGYDNGGNVANSPAVTVTVAN
jgi:Bacterial Ig domain